MRSVRAMATLLVVVTTGCRSDPSGARPNIVLITIDTLRADRLGAYGYRDAQTPRLDDLAETGIRFETAVTASPLTLPSHASVLTSLYPPSHGIRDNALFPLSDGAELLPELLRDMGYDTAAFVGAYVLHSRWGLDRGFDTYDDRFEFDDLTGYVGSVERPAEAVVASAIAWLGKERDAPFFLWTHLFDPHDPYDAPEPYGSRFAERPYDGEIAYADAQVGRLIDALSERAFTESTVVVVTSDHGEALGEHGEPTHGLFLYDATLLVPLIVRLPGGASAGTVVREQVRLIDVAPTLVALAGGESPSTFQGRSLLPLLEGQGAPRSAYSETWAPRFHFGWQELRSLRSDGYKLVDAPRVELYDLADDPDESDNRVDAEPGRLDAMRNELSSFIGDGAQPGLVDAESQQRLRALGYTGAPPADLPDGELPDPKDKIESFRRYNLGESLLKEGRASEAEAEVSALLAEDPTFVSAHLVLGNARFLQGNHAGAIDALRRALELNPSYALARLSLGLAQLGGGDRTGARETFNAILRDDPGDATAHLRLGEMDLEEENPAAALTHFEAALETHPSSPDLYLRRGVAHLQMGDIAAARQALERTVDLAAQYPRAHFYLALVAEAESDAGRAIEEYRKEVEAHPDDHESWFNLAISLADSGDMQGAIEALRGTVTAEPGFAPAHLYLAQALQHSDRVEAERSARKALEIGLPPELQKAAQQVLDSLAR